MSASKRRPPYAGATPRPLAPGERLPPYITRPDGVICRAPRPSAPDAPPPATYSGLTGPEAWLLDIWLRGRTDAQAAEELCADVQTVREAKHKLLARLQSLRVEDPAAAG